MKTHVILLCAALYLASQGLSSAGHSEYLAAWDAATSTVAIRGADGSLRVDQGATMIRFSSGQRIELTSPEVESSDGKKLALTYRTVAPGNIDVTVERDINARAVGPATEVTETFSLTVASPLAIDVEIERPFIIRSTSVAASFATLSPLRNGWAKSEQLTDTVRITEYRLGNAMTGDETSQLSIPAFQVSGASWRCAFFSDPYFSTMFSAKSSGRDVEGSIIYRYAGAKVPLKGTEARTFGVWIEPGQGTGENFGHTLDAYFKTMLPDVPPGPKWLHKIAMVYYDYISDNGQGWERDVKMLAALVPRKDRKRIVLALHGWYDTLFPYCYDSKTKQMKSNWVVFQRTQKLKFSAAELKRRIRLAKDLGFRVILYFSDGLAMESGTPDYREDWVYKDAKGNNIPGWYGPEHYGPSYIMNPAHPEVFQWFIDYMDALLRTYGADLDGFVWDEQFFIPVGTICSSPEPAYCDRALFMLTKALTRKVHEYYPDKVFLSADLINCGPNGRIAAPYGMVADGVFQDTWCDPDVWSYGFFPNWRNVLWCNNWTPRTHFQATRWGVEKIGGPVTISNGFLDDLGPSEWLPWEREQYMDLFHQRLKQKDALKIRYLTEDPAKLVSDAPNKLSPGDPVPTSYPSEVNWALTSNGGRASASSMEPGFDAAAVIDGVRDDTDWGTGHGFRQRPGTTFYDWVQDAPGPGKHGLSTKRGEPLPQSVEVDFGTARTIDKFLVATYETGTAYCWCCKETAGRCGVKDYTIEAWDEPAAKWKPVVTEQSGRAMKMRLHVLPKPIRTSKFRIVVTKVAPLDRSARLLELEAWGPITK